MSTLEFEPKGLQNLFREGIEIRGSGGNPQRGVVMLIKGEPGTGKTTLALQIALTASISGCQQAPRPVRKYYSCEQKQVDLLRRAREIVVSLKLAKAVDWLNKKAGHVDEPDGEGKECFDELMGAAGKRDSGVDNGALVGDGTTKKADEIETLKAEVKLGADKMIAENEINPQVLERWLGIDCKTYFDNNRANPEASALSYRYNNDLYNWVDARISEMSTEAGKIVARRNAGEPQHDQRPALVKVLDGMNLLYRDEQDLIQIQTLIENLRLTSQLGIIILDSTGSGHPPQEFMADIVLEMKGTADNVAGYLLHKLSITKARYQDVAVGWHQYKNRKGGIIVYPSIYYWTIQTGSTETEMESARKPLQNRAKELDEKLNNKGERTDASILSCDLITQMIRPIGNLLKPGSCTVLLGPRRTLKTELSLDFLCTRLPGEQDKNALLISLLDNQGDIPEVCKKLCGRFGGHAMDDPKSNFRIPSLQRCTRFREGNQGCLECFGHVYAVYYRPGSTTPDEFMYWLDAQYREHPFNRLVFWDLTQIESRFPLLASDQLFLPLLIDWLKNSPLPDGLRNKQCHASESNEDKKCKNTKGIISLFMGSPDTTLGRTASAIADNVLFTWRDRMRESDSKERGTAIYLDRSQGMTFNRARDDIGSSNLWWFPDRPSVRESSIEHSQRERHVLVKAQAMINKIQAMQGFDVPEPGLMRWDTGQRLGERFRRERPLTRRCGERGVITSLCAADYPKPSGNAQSRL